MGRGDDHLPRSRVRADSHGHDFHAARHVVGGAEMSIKRWAKNVDANQKQVVEMLRAHGVSVDYWGEKGAPDLVCGYRGVTFLVEVKDGKKVPSARKLRDSQIIWQQKWRGSPVWVVESADVVPTLLARVMERPE